MKEDQEEGLWVVRDPKNADVGIYNAAYLFYYGPKPTKRSHYHKTLGWFPRPIDRDNAAKVCAEITEKALSKELHLRPGGGPKKIKIVPGE